MKPLFYCVPVALLCICLGWALAPSSSPNLPRARYEIINTQRGEHLQTGENIIMDNLRHETLLMDTRTGDTWLYSITSNHPNWQPIPRNSAP